MAKNCPEGFADHFASIEEEPMAAASIGQVHAATLLDGREVVIKFVKDDFEEPFRKDVARMKRGFLRCCFLTTPQEGREPHGLAQPHRDLHPRRVGPSKRTTRANPFAEAIESVKDDFPLERLRFPEIHTDISSERVLVVERVREPSIEDRIDDGSLGWEDLLQLFRIRSLHVRLGHLPRRPPPGNAMLDEDGVYTFIDTGAICEAPEHVRAALFGFFEHLAAVTSTRPSSPCLAWRRPSRVQNWTVTCGTCINCTTGCGHERQRSVPDATNDENRSNRGAGGCTFGEESFPIIRSLMYMDGMVLRSHPDVDLITSMGPHGRLQGHHARGQRGPHPTKQRSRLGGTPLPS